MSSRSLKNQSIGIAVIGAGQWGSHHATVFDTLDDSRLVAVCDVNLEAAKILGRRFEVAQISTDYRDILDNPDVDAVSIATPDFTHGPIIIDALAAGKHVLTEKPLATTVAEAALVRDAAFKSDLKLMVDFHNRVNPVFVSARDTIANNELGSLIHGSARLSNTTFVPLEMLSWASRSSALWFLGSHAVDILRYLLDDEVVRVYARSGTGVLQSRGVNTHDFHVSILEFSKGATITLENSWLLSPDNPMVYDFKVDLVGSAGQIQLDPSHNGAIRQLTGNGMRFADTYGITPTANNRVGGFVLESIARFVDSIINDAPVLASATDGYTVTRVLAAIEQSAESGLAVELKAE